MTIFDIITITVLGVAVVLLFRAAKQIERSWKSGHQEGLALGARLTSDILNSLETVLENKEASRPVFEYQYGRFGVVPESGGLGIPCGLNLERDSKGRYVDIQTSCYWLVWCQSQTSILRLLRHTSNTYVDQGSSHNPPS